MFDHHSRMIYSSLVCFLLLSFPLSLLLCAPPPPSSPVHEERSHVDADVVVDEMEVSEGDADGCKCRVAVNNDVVADVVADVVDDGVERESGDTVAAAAAAAAAAADNDDDEEEEEDCDDNDEEDEEDESEHGTDDAVGSGQVRTDSGENHEPGSEFGVRRVCRW